MAEENPEEKKKFDINDPRSYCYNLTSKEGHVCEPYTCKFDKTDVQKIDDDTKDYNAQDSINVTGMIEAEKTCIPWKEGEVNKSRGQPTGPAKKKGDENIIDELPLDFMSGGLAPPGVVTGRPIDDEQSERETQSLARLAGIAQGPAAILASFGDTETAKESLASLGAMSTGGAIVCECCGCYPCTCGPRGLNIENIVAAIKAMMRSGEDLNKLIGALGPGAMAALDAILSKDDEASVTKVIDKADSPSQIALEEAWLRGDFDEMTSCHCLPGMCPCPGGHYVFKKKTEEKIDEKKKKKRKKIRKKVKKIGKDGKEYEEWDWATPSDSDISRLSETCICPSTKHFLTPESSETEVGGRMMTAGKRIYWGDLMVCTCPRLQRTLAIIKPETVQFKDVVLRAIKNYGLDVLSERKVQLSPEEASEIYAKYYGSARFPNMVVSISEAPVVVLSLGGVDVVKIWNHMIGPDGTLPGEWFLPDWISRKFGRFGDIVDGLHGSKNLFTAENENRYFFSHSYIDPIMKNEAGVKDFIKKNVNPTLLKGLTLVANKRPIDPIVYLAEWLLTHNPFQPQFPTNVSLSPL